MHRACGSLAHVQAVMLRDRSCGKNEASTPAPLAAARAPNVTTVERNLLGRVQLMFLNNIIFKDFVYIEVTWIAVTALIIHTVRLCLWLRVLIHEVGGQAHLRSS